MRSSMVSSSLNRLPKVDELGPDPEPLGLRADVLIARLDSDPPLRVFRIRPAADAGGHVAAAALN